MTLNVHDVGRKIIISFCRIWFLRYKNSFLRSQTTANGTKYIKLYNKRVITLISVNIDPRWDIYGRSRPLISQLGTIFTDISAITIYCLMSLSAMFITQIQFIWKTFINTILKKSVKFLLPLSIFQWHQRGFSGIFCDCCDFESNFGYKYVFQGSKLLLTI